MADRGASGALMVDLLLVMVGLFGLMVVQAGTAPFMDDLRTEMNDRAEPGGNIDAQSINDQIFKAVFKWVGTIAMFGLFLVAAFRAYSRQRVTSVERRRRR